MEKPVIVIIDDDPNLRKTLADILKKEYRPNSTDGDRIGALVYNQTDKERVLP